ncbi:MAG: hypothetical protein KAV82_02965 [Phycisphaerae bacterium]|nr:hypothetical protein [Phycisphaerae bacterium]
MKLVPTRFLFDFEIRLHYRARAPRITGKLADWSGDFLLPPLCRIEGFEPFAPVYACWNEEGLYVATEVLNKSQPPHCEPQYYWQSDCLRICTDMRDTRTNKRASRHCRQFYFMPTGGGAGGDEPAAASVKIARAREDAPPVAPDTIRIASQVARNGYRLEAHIPADVLFGFDPDEHGRIGFYYIIEDRDYGQQCLTVGNDLYWHVDPSTWATAVLSK